MYRADTIVACATAPGRGAVAVVRCSGRDAAAVASRLFRPRRAGRLVPWRMRLGTVLGPDGLEPIDDALGVFFPAPHSFTGEDCFEVHCHGSPLVVEQVVASAIAAGARHAERGEFARRAVLNGKIDLLQAEAIADLVDSRMTAGAEAAWRQLQGALSARLRELRARLVAVLADIEAHVDFSDDDLPEPASRWRGSTIREVEAELGELLAGFPASRRQREGLRLAFTGRPNAGKSSLVNRLLGSGRMIVTDEPGTTRDVVEEAVDLGGVAFVLRDTAGIRDAGGAAESIAIGRAREAVAEADLRVLVIDASAKAFEADEAFWLQAVDESTVVAWNKDDLPSGIEAAVRRRVEARAAAAVSTSAATGSGCEQLVDALLRLAKRCMESAPAGISRVRHRQAVERSLGALARAKGLVEREEAAEIAAIEIRTAIEELASITEPLGSEEVLDRIFATFCLGK